jgi:hypothetical protein
VTTLDHGRAYVGYNLTLGSTDADARKLARLTKRRKLRRVIVDVRLNPGGDNHTYTPLLRALRAKSVNRRGRLVVLISRSTFSAAQNFITELERRTRATFAGETSGGKPEPLRRYAVRRPPLRRREGETSPGSTGRRASRPTRGSRSSRSSACR